VLGSVRLDLAAVQTDTAKLQDVHLRGNHQYLNK
jgi:hypothetical protein